MQMTIEQTDLELLALSHFACPGYWLMQCCHLTAAETTVFWSAPFLKALSKISVLRHQYLQKIRQVFLFVYIDVL